MSKKKKITPSDDFIQSLLEDVQEDVMSSDLHQHSDYSADATPDLYSDATATAQGVIAPMVGSKIDESDLPLGLDAESASFTGKKDPLVTSIQTESEKFWNQAESELNIPELNEHAAEASRYQGPSAGEGAYQSPQDVIPAELDFPKAPFDSQNFEAYPNAFTSPNSNSSSNADSVSIPSSGASFQSGSNSGSSSNFDSGSGFGSSSDSGDEGSRKRASADSNSDDKTVAVSEDSSTNPSPKKSSKKEKAPEISRVTDQTLAVTGFAVKKKAKDSEEEKVVIGAFHSVRPGQVHTSVDASLAQAENLKLAQRRLLELEQEIERLRSENEDLVTAGEIFQRKSEDLSVRVSQLEKEKEEVRESLHSELVILKGSLQFKDKEANKARNRIDELETKLKNDFKKIRVRERELENRLELVRAEKQALVRAKDENILELQRKIDHLKNELETYRGKVQELNKNVESYQDQMKRTVRALRLALTNLEVKDESGHPFRKAE